MKKQQVLDRILEVGIVPVVRAKSAAQAIAASKAVCDGGIPIVEVTLTVPGAVEVIRKLAEEIGDEVLIGAGTVLDAASAQRCLEAGARFLVSPGFDLETVRFARSRDTVVMAGALTPTEVIAAWRAGSDMVKIFPCGTVGGPKYIKALKAPLPQVPMVPTGGVNLQTAAEFIQAGSAALGIGGELVSGALLDAGRTDEITQLARQYVNIVRDARNALAAKTSAR